MADGEAVLSSAALPECSDLHRTAVNRSSSCPFKKASSNQSGLPDPLKVISGIPHSPSGGDSAPSLRGNWWPLLYL